MERLNIPKADYSRIECYEDVAQSIGAIINKYRYTLKDKNKHLEEILDEYDKKVKDAVSEMENRVSIWNSLLGKYWKMTWYDNTPDKDVYKVSYIFPYLVLSSNNTLWMLEVMEGDNYQGGVIDHNRHLDETWNYDTELEEITQEEFYGHATDSVSHVIERRLSKYMNKK